MADFGVVATTLNANLLVLKNESIDSLEQLHSIFVILMNAYRIRTLGNKKDTSMICYIILLK